MINKNRYLVKSVQGIAMGAGMFAIFDKYEGRQIGVATYWRDDADIKARQLNNRESKLKN